MRFLRRSTPTTVGGDQSADQVQDPAGNPRSGAKGRPTPKRRDAQGRRRGPAPPPPRTQREAAKYAKANRPDRPNRDQRRRDAAERRERMAAGDERYLLPRDRGPVKAYIRDVVDSRPHLMGLFMPLAIVIVASLLVQGTIVQQYLSLFSLMAITTMILEGIFLGVSITRRARAKFPNERISGLGTGWYAFTRASQLRRLRIPKPRVQRGANP
ncbi:MAG TPA: DUF3043 domain-containing protein [Pseudonocardia sp.]|nr:DUF3043 domain-containing protein [Pseudonocardia sp.]